MTSWQYRHLIVVSTAILALASSCQRVLNESIISDPVQTEAVIDTTTAPERVTGADGLEAARPSASTVATSMTRPAAPTTTALEAEEAAEPEADDSAEVEEADEHETDKSGEAEEAVADETESATKQSAEPPPLCHELEFNPDDAAEFETVDLSYYQYQTLTASNENYEIVATVNPHPAYGSHAAHDRNGYYRTRESAYEPQTLTVEITDSAGHTMQHQLALDPPEALPDQLHYAVIPDAIVIGPRGWMFAARGITYMKVRELIPSDFEETGPSIGYVDDWYWHEPRHEIDGLYFSVHAGASGVDCFVSFVELGISSTDWWIYGKLGPKGYPVPDDYRGLMWYSDWGGTPVRSDLPESSGGCCKLFALNKGYAVITNQVLGGYFPSLEWPPLLFYSSDGTRWQEIELPRNDLDNDVAAPVWVCEVESTGGDVRIIEGRNFSLDGYGPCEETREWTADPDFSNWRLQEPES